MVPAAVLAQDMVASWVMARQARWGSGLLHSVMKKWSLQGTPGTLGPARRSLHPANLHFLHKEASALSPAWPQTSLCLIPSPSCFLNLQGELGHFPPGDRPGFPVPVFCADSPILSVLFTPKAFSKYYQSHQVMICMCEQI